MSSNRFPAMVWMLGLSISLGGLSAQERAADPALDPQIAALVAQLENAGDPDAREKGLDGLLALGEPGIAVLRDRLSCKDAKLQIEVTPGRVVATVGKPYQLQVQLRNTGTGILWVYKMAESQYIKFSASSPISFGFQRTVRGIGLGGGGGGAYGSRKYINPIRNWVPIRPGETFAKADYDAPLLKFTGQMTVTVSACITMESGQPAMLPVYISPRIPGTTNTEKLLIGATARKENMQYQRHATVLVVPNLKLEPTDPRAKIEIEPKKAVLAASDSHLVCTFRLRNTQPQQQLLLEQDFVQYAWWAWINRDGEPVEWSSWNQSIRENAYKFHPAVLLSPGAALECTMHLRRPRDPGEYTLLAGYEVLTPEDLAGPFIEPWVPAPPITAPFGDEDAKKLLSACKLYALSPPLSIPHAFKTNLPPPRDGEPEKPLGLCMLNAQEAQALWNQAMADAEWLYAREAEIVGEDQILERLAPALLFARTLKVNDERKVMIYYHCGKALVRQREVRFRTFEPSYMYYCVRQARELALTYLRPDDYLLTATLILHAQLLAAEPDLQEAERALDRVKESLETARDSQPWEWVHYLSARMRILQRQKRHSDAIELYKTQIPWLNQALGPHSDGLLELSRLAQEIALEADAAYAAQLEQDIAQLEEARKAIGDPSRGSLAACREQARLARAMGQTEQAEQHLIQTCILARYVSHSAFYEVDAIRALYLHYRDSKQYEKALPLARRLLAETECSIDRSAHDLAQAKANLGLILFALGKKVESAVHLRHALSNFEKAGQAQSPDSATIQMLLDKLK